MNEVIVSNPTPIEIEATLRLAFSHLTEPEHSLRVAQILRQIQQGRIDPSGLFQAKQDGKRLGAVFAQKRLDDTVFFWAPTWHGQLPPDIFFEPLDRFCRENNALAALMMVDRGQLLHQSSMKTAGFEQLSDLLHLIAEVPDFSDGTKYLCNFVPFSDNKESFERLMQITAKSYQETQDFPKLLNIMSVEGYLQGHREAEEYRPDCWYFVQKNGRDIGVLLLTDALADWIELTYMGIASEERGQGVGRELIRFTFDFAAKQGRKHVLTSVDERNIPALKSYQAHGFQMWDRKHIYAKFYV